MAPPSVFEEQTRYTQHKNERTRRIKEFAVDEGTNVGLAKVAERGFAWRKCFFG